MKPSLRILLAATLFLGCAVAGVAAWALSAAAPGAGSDLVAIEPPKLYPVTIQQPEAPAKVDSGRVDIHGQPVMVSCSTCHSTLKPEDLAPADESTRFHKGIEVAHGDVSCRSCHDRDNFDRLALADGSGVDFTDVMTLCSQCHGTQARDYRRGSHGGMTGYWDRTKGPRHRNGCTDCHNPHAPAYPQVHPAFPPHDRFQPVTRS